MQDAAEPSRSDGQHESVLSRAQSPWRGILRFLSLTMDLPRVRAVRWMGARVGSCAASMLLKLWLVYCWLSMLYAMPYGSFADLVVRRYRDEAPTMVPSFLAILSWPRGLLLPGPWLVEQAPLTPVTAPT